MRFHHGVGVLGLLGVHGKRRFVGGGTSRWKGVFERKNPSDSRTSPPKLPAAVLVPSGFGELVLLLSARRLCRA